METRGGTFPFILFLQWFIYLSNLHGFLSALQRHVCVCLCVGGCAHAWRHLWIPEEDIGFLGAGVIGSCESLNLDA